LPPPNGMTIETIKHHRYYNDRITEIILEAKTLGTNYLISGKLFI